MKIHRVTHQLVRILNSVSKLTLFLFELSMVRRHQVFLHEFSWLGVNNFFFASELAENSFSTDINKFVVDYA